MKHHHHTSGPDWHFFQEAMREPIVRAHLEHYRRGSYPTLELALDGCIGTLCEALRILKEQHADLLGSIAAKQFIVMPGCGPLTREECTRQGIPLEAAGQ